MQSLSAVSSLQIFIIFVQVYFNTDTTYIWTNQNRNRELLTENSYSIQTYFFCLTSGELNVKTLLKSTNQDVPRYMSGTLSVFSSLALQSKKVT
jgi:hypothetical protein